MTGDLERIEHLLTLLLRGKVIELRASPGGPLTTRFRHDMELADEIERALVPLAGTDHDDSVAVMTFRDELGEVRRITARELNAAARRFGGDLSQREREEEATRWLMKGGHA